MPPEPEVSPAARVYALVNQARENRSAALAYAAAELPVFPCHTADAAGGCSCGNSACSSVAKHPRTPCGFSDATTDRATVERWWRQWPGANIGIATGGAGWIVLDVDPEGLAAWDEIERREQLPPTLTAKTGRGGWHKVYRMPSDIVLSNRPGALPAGIHVRGAGGYIIAAPSVHELGQLYQWQTIQPPAPLPDALRRILEPAPRATQPQRPTRSDRFITTGTPIPEGQRNNELHRVVSAARGRGAGDDELLELAAEINANRCRPPLADAEVAEIARSACRYEQGSVV